MKNINEAKKHHYIPQFILKNFTDNNGQINYWDISKSSYEKRNTRSIFMNLNMYRDEINHNDNPTTIETQFAYFEQEISNLIDEKIIDKNPIQLCRSELEKLRIFTTLLSFRSDLRKNQYVQNKFDEETRDILLKYQPNGDFEDLWKRELDELSKCRNYVDIDKSKILDPIIKQDFLNDLKGMYITFVDAIGGEFLLSDVYPTLEIFPLLNGANIHLHCLFPISSSRIMILNHIMFKTEITDNDIFKPMIENSLIKGNLILPPKNKYKYPNTILSSEDLYIYTVEKIYSSDVKYINALVLNEARIGVAFANPYNVINSIIAFNKRRDTKRSFNKLEKELSNL